MAIARPAKPEPMIATRTSWAGVPDRAEGADCPSITLVTSGWLLPSGLLSNAPSYNSG
ncbi:hypothetical protein [Blastococcus sp. SYSU DS0973]